MARSGDLDLSGAPRYGVGASWQELPGRSVDIDLQCVVVDTQGAITDCAYYNNLKAGRAVTHSGDEASGKPDKIEEMVWVNVHKVPPNVSLLVFVVAAFSGGSLGDVANGRVHVFENDERREISVFDMKRDKTGHVDVVSVMYRTRQGRWAMRLVDTPAQDGRHFMDVLPHLSHVIRQFIPSAPQRQKVAFAMEKGSVLDLPMDLGRITVGLGWDVDEGECDLDVSAVLMDAQGQDLEAVFFGRLESHQHGIVHTGDNLTGEGEGDDEQIIVNLNQVGGVVKQIVFVVNVYSRGWSFAQVANPFCRVIDEATQQELCRFALRDAGRQQGLIIAKISREAGGRWGFHSLGLPCRGRTFKDSLPEIRAALGIKTSDLFLRNPSTENLQSMAKGGEPWAVPRHPSISSSCRPPRKTQASSMCAVM